MDNAKKLNVIFLEFHKIKRIFAITYLSIFFMVKRNFELTCKMREDLMDAYREVYTKCHSQREAYIKTVKHSAPRFYVSPKQAYDILRPMITGDNSRLQTLPPLKQKMYLELFDILKQMFQRQEFMGKSLWFICQFLVAQPASEFYISVNTFKDIFPSLKKYGKNYHFRDTRSQRKAGKHHG